MDDDAGGPNDGTSWANAHVHLQDALADANEAATPEIDANGVHHVVASHTFTFADGSTTTTSDTETAMPTDVPGFYALTADMDVVSGTGLHEGASGQLVAHGTMDFAAQPAAAKFEPVGAVIECATDSDSL